MSVPLIMVDASRSVPTHWEAIAAHVTLDIINLGGTKDYVMVKELNMRHWIHIIVHTYHYRY